MAEAEGRWASESSVRVCAKRSLPRSLFSSSQGVRATVCLFYGEQPPHFWCGKGRHTFPQLG